MIVAAVVVGCNKKPDQKEVDAIHDPFILQHGVRLEEDELLAGTFVIFVREDFESDPEERNLIDDSDMIQLAEMPRLKSLTVADSQVTSVGFASLKNLRLEQLIVSGTKIDDSAMNYLAGSTELRVLQLDETQITNKAVEFIAGHFPALEELDLSSTSINDHAVPFLAKLQHLSDLDLSNTYVTDASIPVLARMTQLRTLNLVHVPSDQPSVSKKGADRLRRALPKTEVVHY